MAKVQIIFGTTTKTARSEALAERRAGAGSPRSPEALAGEAESAEGRSERGSERAEFGQA